MPVRNQFPLSPNNELFYGADYNPEQWDRNVWEEDMVLMKEAGVNVVSIGIFSWALLERSDDEWDFGWMDDVFEMVHRNGIAIDLGTATASPPPWLTTKHPEILPISKTGETFWPGSRNHFRVTSPIFRKYALRLVQKLAERYGSHPALVAWHVNNELGPQDYSDDAGLAFRKWLEKRYESIDELNRVWGTAFWSQRYNCFDEIVPPRKANTFINPTSQLDFARFSSDALADHLNAETGILHKLSPDIPVTTNYMLAGQTKGMDVANWAVDFVSNDHYRFQSRDLDEDELSFSASLTSSVAGFKPWWLMEHSTSAVNWQQVNVRKPRGQLIRDSLTHVAHGADAVCFFQWRQSSSGAEKYHSSMVPHAGRDSRVFRNVVQLGRNLRALSEVKGSSKKPAPVAIIWDWESWHGSEMDGHPSSLVDYFREAREWWVALMNHGIRVDVIPPHIGLDGYEMLVAPMLYLVRDSVRFSIERFVERGGHFVTTYSSGVVDANDHVILGGYPGVFRELLGIRVEEWAPLLKHDSIKLDDGSSATIWTEEVDVVGSDVDVLRRYVEGELSGKPAVTRRSHDSGSATYVSARLGLEGLQRLVPDLLSKAQVQSGLPQPLWKCVEQVIRQSQDGKTEWEFIINRTGKEVDLEDIKGELVVASGGAEVGKLAARRVAVFRHSS